MLFISDIAAVAFRARKPKPKPDWTVSGPPRLLTEHDKQMVEMDIARQRLQIERRNRLAADGCDWPEGFEPLTPHHPF